MFVIKPIVCVAQVVYIQVARLFYIRFLNVSNVFILYEVDKL